MFFSKSKLGTPEDAKRILFIDDNGLFLNTVSRYFRDHGDYVTVTCQDTKKVIRLLHGSPVDAIILDIQMPVSRFEFLKVLQRHYPHLPVIFLSGQHLDEGFSSRVKESGAVGIVSKDNSLGTIFDTIQNYLLEVEHGQLAMP